MNYEWDDSEFIKGILDGMYDWVRVIDRDDCMLFVNHAMAEGLKCNPVGKKCYEAIGKSKPCDNCTSRRAVFDGQPHEKEEVIGDKIFSVMSSPLKNSNGEVTAVVEVLRDITQARELQEKVLKQNQKLQYDLNIAKKLQCSLLPKNLPDDKLKFAFVYKPCEALGGDFLDIFPVDRDHLGLYIADVSGHGVPASLLTIFLRSSINKKLLSPSAALTELYHEFNNGRFDSDLYITVFYAVFNWKTNKFTYSNAGHNVLPVLFNESRFDLLRVPGVPISNWVEEPDYKDITLELQSGDRIFLYTDGIIELRNSYGQQYGEERLLNILLNDNSEPAGTLNNIIEDTIEFTGAKNSNQICDDITMLLMELEP